MLLTNCAYFLGWYVKRDSSQIDLAITVYTGQNKKNARTSGSARSKPPKTKNNSSFVFLNNLKKLKHYRVSHNLHAKLHKRLLNSTKGALTNQFVLKKLVNKVQFCVSIIPTVVVNHVSFLIFFKLNSTLISDKLCFYYHSVYLVRFVFLLP